MTSLYDRQQVPERNHNNPPSLIEFAIQSADDGSNWLKKNPVIETEEQAKAGKLFNDRFTDCIKDADVERKSRKKPHQEQMDLIDGEYRSPIAILEKVRAEIRRRLDVFIKEKEKKRLQAIEDARKKEEEAERRAREAERAEQDAIGDAALGVEVDLAAVTRTADADFRDYERSRRERARLENSSSSIREGWKRAYTPHQHKELIVTNPDKALATMGWSERLLEALKSDARLFKREHGIYPDGIIEEIR